MYVKLNESDGFTSKKNNVSCNEEDSSEFLNMSDCNEFIVKNEAEVLTLEEQISAWAIKHGITYKALNELLEILRKAIPSLPVDARNLTAHKFVRQDHHRGHTEEAEQAIATNTPVGTSFESLLTSLTQEVASLRKEVQEIGKDVKILKRDKNMENVLVMPAKPYIALDEFFEFEKKLQDDEGFLKCFQKELRSVAKSPNFIKNCWRKIFQDELAEKLCWKGTEEKQSVRNLNTTQAIRDAAISLGETEESFIKSTKSFFQFAKNRQQLRASYKKNK